MEWREVVYKDPNHPSKDLSTNVLQIWNFDHFNQRYVELSDAVLSNDLILRNTETSCVKYLALSAIKTFEDRFHFKLSVDNGQASIGEGAVQIGGYTYFSSGGVVTGVAAGVQYVCAECTLTAQPPTIAFQSYPTTGDLNQAQGNHDKYVFPLYKLVNGNMTVDYRPLANAGCWEVPEGNIS